MLLVLRQTLFSQLFRDEHRISPTDFVRNRILTFPMVVLAIANFLKGSLQDELDQLFQAIFKLDVAKRVVTRSALSQARRKISHTAFVRLLDAVCGFLNLHAPMLTFHGMRAFAIDGSTLRLPNRRDVKGRYGGHNPDPNAVTTARVSLLHDVLNRITYDAILEDFSIGENPLAWQHLEEADLPDNSLLLGDRNYGDFALLREIRNMDHHFCVRLKSNLSIVKVFMKTGLPQAILKYRPSKSLKRGSISNSPCFKSFDVRLIRFRTKKGEVVLMTSLLDAETISASEIINLYNQRWQVEESFKVKKCRLRLEDLSGATPEIIRQDFHAKVFAECLSSALALELRDKVEAYCMTTRNEYRISLTQILAKMKNTIVLLFIRPKPEKLLGDLLEIFAKSLVDCVPGRSFRRKNAGRTGPKMETHSSGYRFNR